MKRTLSVCAGVVAVLAAISHQPSAMRAQTGAPSLQVNPFWPQPLPNHWVFGSITGVAVDAQDHVWVAHRGADSLEGNEKGMMATPPTSIKCCVAAPFVVEFDADGKLLSSFGGPGQGYQWPQSRGGLALDAKGNVWMTAAGLDPAPPGARGGDAAARGAAPGRGRGGPAAPADAHVLKFA